MITVFKKNLRVLALLLVALMAFVPPAFAQEASGDALAAEAPADAAASAEGEPAAEPEPELAPELTASDVDSEELKLRVVPLQLKELEALAGHWSGEVESRAQAVIDNHLELEKQKEAGANTEALAEKSAELLTAQSAAIANLRIVSKSLRSKGADIAIVDQIDAYANSLDVATKANADWRTLLKFVSSWLVSPEGGLQILFRILIVAMAFLALLIVARMVRRTAGKALTRADQLSKLMQAFLMTVIYWVTLAIGLMVTLGALGVDITPLFALFGGASFILAFALQETLGNLASGILIMINRPFDEGDYVETAGVSGTVDSVSVVSTKVTTPDNQVIVIPNSKVWGDVITNVTASTERRVDLLFGVGYDDPAEKVERILREVVEAHPLCMKEPAPVIKLHELADNSVNFICRPWVKVDDYWTVYWDLMRSVKEAFDREDIGIPYPQRDVHLNVLNPAVLTGPGPSDAQTPGQGKDARSSTYAKDDDGRDDSGSSEDG